MTMFRVVSTWGPKQHGRGDIEWTLMDPGIDVLLKNVPSMQMADITFVADLRGDVLDLPRTPDRIALLLLQLGLFDGARSLGSSTTRAVPADVSTWCRTHLPQLLERIESPAKLNEWATTHIVPVFDAVRRAKPPKSISPEAFAVALARHFTTVRSTKAKIDFSTDPRSTAYKSIVVDLAQRCGEQLARIVRAGHTAFPQEILILLGADGSNFRQLVIDALLGANTTLRKTILSFGTPDLRPVEVNAAIHPVISTLPEMLHLVNRLGPLLLPIPPYDESLLARELGPGLQLHPLLNRAGRTVGFECHVRNLTAGLLELHDTIANPDAVCAKVLEAMLAHRTGEKIKLISSRSLVLTGKSKTSGSWRRWEILVNGKSTHITSATLEKLLAYIVAKHKPTEGSTGIALSNPLIAGKPPKAFGVSWPWSPDRGPQDVRKAIGEGNLLRRTDPKGYEIIWTADQIDVSGLRTSDGLERDSRRQSIRKLLALL